MTPMAKLLRLFRVDQQISGLEGRLRGAQRFLDAQTKALNDLNTRRASLAAQVRQITASASNLEGEANTIGARIDALREKMNSSSTTKEYQALLVEVGKLSADKGRLDEQALALMEKAETLKAEIEQLDSQIAERSRVVAVARQDRDARDAEIRDRVEALRAERAALASDAPRDALRAYESRRDRYDEDDEIMAPLVEQNMKRHEFTCGSCMMGVPVDLLNALMAGKFSTCTSCGVILYLEESTVEKVIAGKK